MAIRNYFTKFAGDTKIVMSLTCPLWQPLWHQTKAKTAQEVYDFVWGKHLTEAEYEDRPLSKLTKDILDQLEIKR